MPDARHDLLRSLGAEDLLPVMPRAKLVALADAGHFLPADKPQESAALIARFAGGPCAEARR